MAKVSGQKNHRRNSSARRPIVAIFLEVVEQGAAGEGCLLHSPVGKRHQKLQKRRESIFLALLLPQERILALGECLFFAVCGEVCVCVWGTANYLNTPLAVASGHTQPHILACFWPLLLAEGTRQVGMERENEWRWNWPQNVWEGEHTEWGRMCGKKWDKAAESNEKVGRKSPLGEVSWPLKYIFFLPI